MAKLPTYEEMGKKIAEEALDGYIYKGKTLREWVDILAQTKSEYEHDHDVVKAYNDGQAYILDKIRTEIEKESEIKTLQLHWGEAMGLNKTIEIIDKYRGE